MKIIAGTAKGKKLIPVPGDSTRPMLGRVKATIFDILRPNLEKTQVLDLFAGTGSLGLEALSQGAKHCVFIDLNKNAYKTLQKNIKFSALDKKSEIRNTDAFSYLRNTKKTFDLIFLDPPYFGTLWIEALQKIAAKPELLSENAKVMCRVHPSEYEKLELVTLHEFRSKKMGNSYVMFFERK